jgi:hypothetical protein
VLEFLEIGIFLNGELAAAIKEHLDPRAGTIADRVIQARAFERAMEANESRLLKELERLVKGERGR